MEFKTQYDEHKRVFTNPGSPMKTVYKMRLDDKGRQVLEKMSEYSLYDEIQSHFEETEIHALVDRYKLTGDPSVLNRQLGQYGDFTDLPTSLADVYKRVADANNLFEELPIDIRREYNFSPAQFFADIGSERSKEIFSKLKLSEQNDVPSVLSTGDSPDPAAMIEQLQQQIATLQGEIDNAE